MTPDGLGGYEYSGYTDIWWDTQKTAVDQWGYVTLNCEDHHQWDAVKEEVV